MNKQWEARSAMRYGSKHEAFFKSREDAVMFAQRKIQEGGNIGSLKIAKQVVYYDVYEEEA